jgi:SMC interacting uncharacterized protein involved in chromosome segregation
LIDISTYEQDHLTVNEENRLRKEIVKLTQKNSEFESMEIKREQEIRGIRDDMEAKFQQIVSLHRKPVWKS